MKNFRFHINLYVIVPLIFGGFSILSLLVAYQLTRFYLDRHTPPEWPLAFWGTMLFIFTFTCGLLVVKFIIAPVERFVDHTKTLGVLDSLEKKNRPPQPMNEIYQYTHVFDQVTEILSKVEARELFPEIIGQSTIIRGVLNQIIKVAKTDSTVLIVGETGTGKELVTNSIHRHSVRSQHTMIAINCAAIPEGLLESELFGHEKGAFTGATSRKAGKIEQATKGTLFLDEVGDMPLETQAKLLRALEENAVVRLGGNQLIEVDTRFITATNKNLPDLVKSGSFRQDLYFRLNVFTIYLPPLRDRREDIPLLSNHFVSQFAPTKKLSSPALQMLMTYDWPGNIRELKNAIQSATVMAMDDTILPIHLPGFLLQPQNESRQSNHQLVNISGFQPIDLDSTLQEYEQNLIVQALSQCHGVQKQAAELLQIKERSLWHRIKKYNIDASTFKPLKAINKE